MPDDIINKLSEIFTKFPGIGPKQARRFVYFLLGQQQGSLNNLAQLIGELKRDIHQCEICTRFFIVNRQHSTLCELCSDLARDNSILMIVEKDIDLNNIRKLGVYNGQFAVLGGLLPILEKNPSEKIRQNALLKNIEQKIKTGALKEIIIAISVTREGDNTADYLKQLLRPYEDKDIKVTLLGRGLSSGTEIEYTDSDTIKNALINRH
jgi:recombination protein RecR